MEHPQITMWDHLNNITYNKGRYLGDEGWNIYMINRFLSMDENYCEIVDAMQKNLRLGSYIPNEAMYEAYKDLIPKQKKYLKYIKAENIKKYDEEELSILSKHFEISQREAKSFVDMMDKKILKDLITQYKGK
jgi:hypothetical protein